MNWHEKMRMQEKIAYEQARVLLDLADYVDEELSTPLVLPQAAFAVLCSLGTGDHDFAPNYAEPGWSVGNGVFIVGFGWKPGEREITDRLYDSLERSARECDFGVETTDYYTTCTECGNAVETQPSSYWWKPRFHVGDGWLACHECLENMGYAYDEESGDYVELEEGDFD